MSIPSTSLNSTFNTWRTNTNTTATNLGDVALLTTSAGTAVGAVNELDAEIGTLSSLSTTDKTTLVAAINEVDGDVGAVASLTTTVKTSTVAAINELDGEIGTLSNLSTTDKTTLVAAINETLASISSVSSINDLSGTLSVSKGGTGQTSLNDVIAGSSKVTVTNGTGRIIGGDVTINVSEPDFNLANMGGTLGITHGGTGRTSLDDIVSGSNIITITNGSDTIVGGDCTINIVTTNITSLGTLTSLTVSGTSTLAATNINGALTTASTIAFNHTTPPLAANVPLANISNDKHLATKEYVDTAVISRNTEVEFDSDELIPLRKTSGNNSFTINHGMSGEPDFVMAYIGTYAGNETGDCPLTYMPCMSSFSAGRFRPYTQYNATTIEIDHNSDSTNNWVERIREPGVGQAITLTSDEVFYRYFAVNKTPDYTSGWNNAMAANTSLTFNHALGIFPTFVTVELAENNDGSGWRIPIMSMAACNPDYQCCMVKMDTSDIIVRSKTYLANTLDNTQANLRPTTGYVRVQAWNWTPDYDSEWFLISDSGNTAEQLLQHDLDILPSLVMVYLSDDTSIAGTTNTPTGTWVTQCLTTDINSQGVHILHMNKKFIYIQAGTSEVADLYDSTGSRNTTSGPVVARVLAWK